MHIKNGENPGFLQKTAVENYRAVNKSPHSSDIDKEIANLRNNITFLLLKLHHKTFFNTLNQTL